MKLTLQPTSGRRFRVACRALLLVLAPLAAQPPSADACARDADEVENVDPYWTPRLEESAELRQLVAALRALRDPNAPRGPELARSMSAEARAHLGELFVVLRDGEVPALEEGSAQPLSESQLELTLDLFAATSRRAVLSALEIFLAQEGQVPSNPAVARVAMRAYDAVGRASELNELFDHAGSEELDRATERALRSALVSILERDPEAYDWLERRRSSLDDTVLPAVVLAIGDAGDPRAILLVTHIAKSDPGLAVACLSQVGALGPSESRDVNELVRYNLRGFLDSDQLMLRRAAILALGRLHDIESVARIAVALGEPSRGAREDAATALRNLSGLQLESTPVAWKAWRKTEQAWFEEEGQRELRALESAELSEVVEAFRTLSQHRLHRLLIAAEFERCLRDQRPEVRRLACVGLQELGTRESAPALRAALGDVEQDVREAAERALRAVTAP